MARALRAFTLRSWLKIAFTLIILLSGIESRSEEVIRSDLRLTAADLVDEVVYSWLKNPPVSGLGSNAVSIVVANITAPIGIDNRFDEAIENHLFELLRANPSLPVSLVHCSVCRQWVTYSTPEKTIIGRALDHPENLAQLRQLPHAYALSLHFDVAGNDLILWAEIYQIAPPQKIVWAKRFSQSTSARALLRQPYRLISIEEARQEQRQILEGRDSFQAVTRFPIRNFFAKGSTLQGTEVPPLIFLEQSFEAILLPRHNQRIGLSIGLTSIKDSLQGWSFGASYMMLLGRPEPSLTAPDLYLRTGASYIRLEGPGSAVFGENQIDVGRLINSQEEPRSSLTAFQLGLEAHVKHRFGLSVFVEYIPTLNSSPIIETKRLILPFQNYGVSGVLLW